MFQNKSDSQKRSDKISKLLGDYLLKRYVMLGSTCTKCDTILLKTPAGIEYCVGCSEIDNTIPDIITDNDFVKKSTNNQSDLNAQGDNDDKILSQILKNKIVQISQKLEREKDLDNQIKILQIIKLCFENLADNTKCMNS
ncbi:unnamed protein product [Gordionus sp. m RMFG-2023]|uniref:uncharacterized protein LOC135928324 n=1 Tax=Gordionus sp. m RMFG-2023 TaxID=3053472 RepID=UPI0030DE8FCE